MTIPQTRKMKLDANKWPRTRAQWHNWFAWWPVDVGIPHVREDYRWLEVVQRRINIWRTNEGRRKEVEYRPINKEEEK